MKKIISYMLVLCMALSTFSFFAVDAGATYGYLLGDADDSTQINMKDILLTRRYVAGLTSEKDINLTAADADKSTAVNLKDVLLIRKHIAGTEYLEDVNEDGKYKVGLLSIGSRNISRFTIVLPPDATECMENAANILKNDIAKACGYTLSVANNESKVSGYKIRFAFDSDDEYALGLEGYRVYVDENGDMNIICGSLRGPVYAAYYILEELIGYRYFPGMSTYLYESDSIDIGLNYDATEIPGYSYRALAQIGGGDYPIQLRLNDSSTAKRAKNGWGVGTLYIHAHSYANQEAGFDNTYKSDVVAKYEQKQPCLVDETFYEKALDHCLRLIAERENWGQHFGEEYTMISCSPNDNTNFCQCQNCKNIYEIEGSIAGTVFRLSNRVIEAIQEVYPDMLLYTIAYWDARNPPKMTRPHDDICVCFCIGGCNNHTYDDTASCVENGGNPRHKSPTGANSSNDEDMDFCAKWGELTNRLQIWYYSTTYHYYLAPAPNIPNVYNDFKFLAEIGATEMYNEGSSRGYTFEKLRGYLAAKMMWNPNMSEEEFNTHINEYLAAYCGEGWTYIREYLDMQTEAGDLNGCWTNNFDRPWNMYNQDYILENYEYMLTLFDKAYGKAKTGDERNHIELIRMHVDFLGLSATFESDYANGDEASRALYAERYARLYNTIVNNNVDVTALGLNGRGCEVFPASESDIRCPMNWIFEDFTGYWEYKNGGWV